MPNKSHIPISSSSDFADHELAKLGECGYRYKKEKE